MATCAGVAGCFVFLFLSSMHSDKRNIYHSLPSPYITLVTSTYTWSTRVSFPRTLFPPPDFSHPRTSPRSCTSTMVDEAGAAPVQQ
eukprot:scaffold2604_cov198-Alexandrium_tamarense.AAC.16